MYGIDMIYFLWTYPNPRGTQMAHLNVLIGRCALNNQLGGLDRHPTNVGHFYFNETMHLRDTENVIYCYFKRSYKKRMIEIWSDSTTLDTN